MQANATTVYSNQNVVGTSTKKTPMSNNSNGNKYQQQHQVSLEPFKATDSLDNSIHLQTLPAITSPAIYANHFTNKSNIAKLQWWNTPMSTIPLPPNEHQWQQQQITTDADKGQQQEQHHYHQHKQIEQQHIIHNKRLHSQHPLLCKTIYNNQHAINDSRSCINSNTSLAMVANTPIKQNTYDILVDTVVIEQQHLNEELNVSQDSQLLVEDQKPCDGLLNRDEEDEMKVTGYSRSRVRTLLCWLCVILTGGLLRLILHWWRHWYLIATHVPCSLEKAEKVLIQEDYQGKHKIFYVKKVLNLNANRLSIKRQQHEEFNGINDDVHKNGSCITNHDNVDGKNQLLSVHFSSAQFKSSENVRIINCKQLRYAWDNQTQTFIKLKGLDINISSTYFYQQKGLTPQEQLLRRIVYGPNLITVPYKDLKTLLILETLNPFYVFQIFSVVLWFTYDYYYYACVILIMSVFGIAMSTFQTKKNQDALLDTVQNTGFALVIDERGTMHEMPTHSLVPGDIIEIPSSGCTMQCDAVLLSGNCILDESMLTGESVPVTKTPLPKKRDVIFDKKEHARHTLFCGTKVIQTRYIGSEKVLAFVINTGNITAKGGLIRSILYPPPVDYKFEQDSYKFIECLGLIALIGFVYTLVSKIMRDIDPTKIAVESLDLITIVVPPALPAAMTVGRFNAQKRLEHKEIYCISPRSINVAGSIDCCCFDKTGTLTEDGLDMWGVVPKSAINQFQMPIRQIERLPYDHFLFCMATCHSITIMNGKKMGDPLDLKMFESTGWLLEDPKDIPDSQKYGLIHPTVVRPPKATRTIKQNINETLSVPSTEDLSNEMQRQSSVDDLLADVGLLSGESRHDHGLVREFPFTSNLQRMSVITRCLSERNFNVYCKGSPEMVQQLCQPKSLPENYSQQLAVFAKQGYRVIALAYKPLSVKTNYTKVQRLAREHVECDLEFLGFVVLENRLKPDTTDVICMLNKANVRSIMVTGDNILTALSVARDCGIVNTNQAVVTVNVRHRHNKEHESKTVTERHMLDHIFELYYTLELGSKECVQTSPTSKFLNGNKSICDALDYDCDSRALYGDVVSLSSALVTTTSLPNSNSLVSVQTFDTWTHGDVELGFASSTSCNETKERISITQRAETSTNWRANYRFAMVGKTWQVVREHFPDKLQFFLTRGAIFARMSPEQKQSLIIELQNINYCVAMCGDGANDCGALKVAHTGISLSETESSIASPFTSRQATIACVPTVIKEGRAALITSFGIFKYMAAYSMVQFISVMILYSIDSNLTDKQYLYIDLGLISVFAFFFGKTGTYAGSLVKQVPLSSLISLTPLSSIILHLLVVIAFQVAGWFQLHQQSWFEPFQLKSDEHLGCYENYTMFSISCFQYISLAFVFSKGAPYRQAIWTNVPFCLALILNLFIVCYLVLYPFNWLANFFQLELPPTMGFRYLMLIYGLFNFLAHVFVETIIVEMLLFQRFYVRREHNLQTSKRQYMKIEYDLQYLKNWPPITHEYEAYDETTRADNKPTYIEISAEQNCELSTVNNNALNSFFEVETPTSTTIASFNDEKNALQIT